MGKAYEIVEKIVNEKLCNNELLLSSIVQRKWKKFNLFIGENGAGKSRLLKLIKDYDQTECLVIHMDFSWLDKINDKNESNNDIVGAVVFNKELEKDILNKFVTCVNEQVLNFFNQILLMKGQNDFISGRAEEIINALNPTIEKVMGRKVVLRNEKICLQKGDSIVDVDTELELLSPGERSILVIAISILIINTINKSCILLIDEIETHLHPLAQMEIMNLLRSNLNEHDHCTCIASHSLFLLPKFSIDEIVYIENGVIQKINGRLYHEIYNKMVGDDGEESLSVFLTSVAYWEYSNYLAECFLPPTTEDKAKKSDAQACQLKELLKSLYDDRKLINVLDFGAGSGRIGKCLDLMLKDKEDIEIKKICNNIKYNIYDKYKISEDFIANHGWHGEAYSTEDSIRNDKESFDIILLFNVLHEIGIDEWEKELNFVFELLKDDGVVLFGERRVLSVGERPYGKSGYLVLGDEELKSLFYNFRTDIIPLSQEIDDLTICYAIGKKDGYESIVNEDNIKSAIELLEKNSRNKIKEIQNMEKDEDRSIAMRKYAFYCQQYVNAQEAIDILCGEQADDEKYSDLKFDDIIQSFLPQNEKKKLLEKLAECDTEDGYRSREYLKGNKRE